MTALQKALAAAVKPPLSPEQLGLPGQDMQVPGKPQCARVAGFSLHGAQSVMAGDREGLERLCRYGLRAPFAQERLSLRADGRVAYQLRALDEALAAAVTKNVLSLGAVRQILDLHAHAAGKPPPITVVLPDDPRVRDLIVKPHALTTYDHLQEETDDEEPGDDQGS